MIDILSRLTKSYVHGIIGSRINSPTHERIQSDPEKGTIKIPQLEISVIISSHAEKMSFQKLEPHCKWISVGICTYTYIDENEKGLISYQCTYTTLYQLLTSHPRLLLFGLRSVDTLRVDLSSLCRTPFDRMHTIVLVQCCTVVSSLPQWGNSQ